MGFALSVYFAIVVGCVGVASYFWGIGPTMAVFVAICGICSAGVAWLWWVDEPMEELRFHPDV
jgi:hypothetical protein